jgi:hypothetical protein
MDLTNLQALLNDQKAGSGSELTSHQLAFKLPSTRHSCLTDGLWWRPLLTRGWGWPEEQSLAAAFLDKKLTCVSWMAGGLLISSGSA